MCFVDLEKAFDRVSRKVMEWALRKKKLLKILVKAVMSLYEGSKTKFKVGSEFSKDMYQLVYIRDLFCTFVVSVVDVVTENARKGLMKEVLYIDDLVLMSQTMKGLKKKLVKWRSAMESKGLRVNLERMKVIVCESEGKVIWSRIEPCEICGKRVIVNSVLCTKCDQWIHGRFSKMKKAIPSAARLFVCNKYAKATNGAVEVKQEVISDKVETVKGFCDLGNRLNASEGCKIAVTARKRLLWKKFRKCEEILFGKRFFLHMKGKV